MEGPSEAVRLLKSQFERMRGILGSEADSVLRYVILSARVSSRLMDCHYHYDHSNRYGPSTKTSYV